MAASELSGKVQTVLGPKDPGTLGVTLTHEHVLMHFKPLFVEPEEASQKAMARHPITLEELGWVRFNWASHREHLGLYDEEEIIEEVSLYDRAGGQSLVEASSIGLGRDPLGLARVSRATGLNIIMGSGYYVEHFQSEDWKEMGEDAMVEQIVKDVMEGVGDTGIRSGIIGEVGCSWPWTEAEKRSVRAAARAQRETGAPLLIHPGRHPSAPLEITEVIAEAGGDLRRTIMSHIDRTIPDYEAVKKLAETGCYIEYDLFGLESAIYPLAPIDMPNDGKRVDFIVQLIRDGHLDQIVVAHDTAFQTRLVRYGGHGYAHLIENVIPIMRRKGMTQEQVQAIFVENPKRMLTFV
ncbi:MAG: phosphotriesterase-related protein [Dehalococcoidia bacterium]